eukprot:1509967-Lingulodinium_polyedra.AAC.1
MVTAVSSCIRRLGARRCTERHAADAFVVRNPSAASSRTTLCAQLSGCRLCSPEYLQSGGVRGASRVYQKMLDRPRWIWCSAAFEQLNPEKYDILKRKIPGTRWRWLPDKATAVAKAQAAAKTKGSVMLFVSAGEQRSDASIASV